MSLKDKVIFISGGSRGIGLAIAKKAALDGAKIMFNKLIQISSPVFSTSVAYLIPVVAIIWGFVDGEKVSYLQLLAGIIILAGIYIVNRVK